QPLRHHAVEPRALEALEPVLGESPVTSCWRAVQRRRSIRKQLLQSPPARLEGLLAQVLVVEGQQVPRDERGGRLRGEELDARCSRVDAQQQRLEIESVRADNDDLAVDDAALGQLSEQRIDELRKIAVHRLGVSAL